MTFEYWTNFYKRINSTKQPSSSATSVTVRLKENTSILAPTIILNGNLSAAISYAYISDFNRYYFITDVRYIGVMTEIDMTVDVLASYKTDVGSYEGYIVRCSDSSWYNNKIADPLNPVTSDYKVYENSIASTVFGTGPTGYILSVIGKNSSGLPQNGFASAYYVTLTEMANLKTQFSDPTVYQSLLQEFQNPMESIVSCKVTTIPATHLISAGTAENIFIGSYDTQCSGYRISSRYDTFSKTLTLPSIASTIYGYRLYEPYATYFAYLPFVGVVPIDYQTVGHNWELTFDILVDYITGNVIYKIYNGDSDDVVATYTGCAYSDAPISSTNFSATGLLTGTAMAIGGTVAAAAITALTGGSAAPALAAAAGGIGTAIKSLEQNTQINGQLSTGLGGQVGTNVIIYCIFRETATSITDHAPTQGLPCCSSDQVMSHSGFLQMLNASVDIPGFESEKRDVNNFLNSGFFYE